jgi:hypothetical protein
MNRKDAIAWVLGVCALHLRRSQAKTLSELVAAALSLVRTSLSALGRCLSANGPVVAKHCIKRVDRFLGNRRIEPVEAMRGPVQWLARPGKRLLVSIDWVDIRQLHCLVLAARLRGRAVPLLWAVYRREELFRSQNNLEYGLLRALRTMVPDATEVVLLGDRGFGRTEMARVCQQLGFDYILRISPDVWVSHPQFEGKLLDLPIRRGTQRMLRHVAYRKERPVTQHVAVLWRADREEPWFLATNLPQLQAKALSRVYGRRMTIEEYFRDTKSKRNGQALRLSLIRGPERLARMLLVLALAYWLLVAVGLHAAATLRPSHWCSSSKPGLCSLFTIGRRMVTRLKTKPRPIMNALRCEVLQAKWG